MIAEIEINKYHNTELIDATKITNFQKKKLIQTSSEKKNSLPIQNKRNTDYY